MNSKGSYSDTAILADKPNVLTTLTFRVKDRLTRIKFALAKRLFNLSMKLYGENDSSYIRFAKQQFELMGYKPIEKEKDGPNKWIQENVYDVLKVIASQGHSGSSIYYMKNFISNFMIFNSVIPCEDKPEQWNEIGDDEYQHKLCSALFKKNGIPYHLDGYIFGRPDGSCYTNSKSRKVITFPFTPSTFTSTYVKVDEEGNVLDEVLRKEIEDNQELLR